MREKEFTALYQNHASRVYNYILWMTRDRDTGNDILQTVFIRAWNNPSLPADPDEQAAWLFTVARNACMDLFRSHKRFARLCQTVEENRPLPEENDGEAGLVWRVLADLGNEERSIIYLHIKMGYNYREIGEILDMQESAVRVRAFRALRRLREKLEKETV